MSVKLNIPISSTSGARSCGIYIYEKELPAMDLVDLSEAMDDIRNTVLEVIQKWIYFIDDRDARLIESQEAFTAI